MEVNSRARSWIRQCLRRLVMQLSLCTCRSDVSPERCLRSRLHSCMSSCMHPRTCGDLYRKKARERPRHPLRIQLGSPRCVSRLSYAPHVFHSSLGCANNSWDIFNWYRNPYSHLITNSTFEKIPISVERASRIYQPARRLRCFTRLRKARTCR